MLVLLIFFVCISFGLILYYTELYEFVVVDKLKMAERKRYCNSKSSKIYKLQVNKFTKLYATESNQGPRARSGHRIVCKNSALYSVGGYNPDLSADQRDEESLLHEVWRFDFITRLWKKLEFNQLPYELASCATVLSGNLMFLYGGTGFPFGTRINDKVYICRLEDYNSKLLFEPLAVRSEQNPAHQYGQSIALDGKYLYTVGGTDGFRYSMDVYRLDMKELLWEKLFERSNTQECPAPRYRHEIVHFKNYLYVLGGGTSNNTFSLKTIPAFDLHTNKWISIKTIGDNSRTNGGCFPASRRCHGCVQDPYDKSIVFINGGYNDREIFNDTWRLDLNSFEWKCIDSLRLPYGLYFHSASSTADGRMVIFGGIFKGNPHQRTADVYSAWIRVPKLAEACWEALGFYISNKIIQLPKDLKTLELPIYYESRLRTSFNFS